MSDKTKRLLFIGVLGLVVAGLIWIKNQNPNNTDNTINKNDPSVLPPPTREFGEWSKYWEQQR